MAQPALVIDGLIFELNPSGGAARMWRALLSHLGPLRGADTTVLLTSRPGRYGISDVGLQTRMALPVDRFVRPRRLFAPVLPALTAWAKNRAAAPWRHPESIWHSTFYTMPSPADWPGRRVTTVLDMAYERAPEFFTLPSDRQYRSQKDAAIRAADSIVCISQATADDVADLYPVLAGRIRIITPALDDVFRSVAPQSRPLQAPYLLYVGERRSYKNFHGLLHVYAQWKERTNVRLAVMGPPWTLSERRTLHELGLTHEVVQHHDVSDNALARWYTHAAALVYPSYYEGYGLPILEAMACGCPVVASDIPSSREVGADVACFFRLDDDNALSASLDTAMTLRTADAPRMALGQARALAAHWVNSARALAGVYEELSG